MRNMPRMDYNFTEEMPRAQGIGATVRRTQPIIGMAYLNWFSGTEGQTVCGPRPRSSENPNEHGISRTLCAHVISEHYRKEYEEIFGPLPEFPKNMCLPIARPDPSDNAAYAAWTSIPPEKAAEITRVYANMGKAIAAYERLIIPGPSPFDEYVEALLKGDREEMSWAMGRQAVEGLRLFIGKAKCVECHNGPLLPTANSEKRECTSPLNSARFRPCRRIPKVLR